MAKPWENPTKYPWYSMVTRCYLHGRSYMGWIYVWLCDIIYGMADIFLSQHHELKMAYQVRGWIMIFPIQIAILGYAMPCPTFRHIQTLYCWQNVPLYHH
jgi:hypothetical protein